MTMPVRWSVLVLILLFLLSLLTFSSISRSKANHSSRRASKKSSLTLHHLQEEQNLRNRNALILQDIEENDLRLELACTPTAARSSSPNDLTPEELALQKSDFELELAREVQHQVQHHPHDGTLLNESPSALHRHLERKLRNQKRLLSAYKESLKQHPGLAYSSPECVAWRAKQQQRREQEARVDPQARRTPTRQQLPMGRSGTSTALARFQQSHPQRDLEPESTFAQTLNALGDKRYTDPNGFVVELDPIKITAGSRRAEPYQNDDIHVLVLDMQWDPEVTVVVGNVLDETVKLRQEGYRPVMLNVGNSQIPGGDYHLDSTVTSEADLFRRTTLHQCLDQEPRRSRFYPLSENGGIYCPNQAVFRHGLDRDNEFMDRFEWVSVVSVAPIPKLETREKDGGLGGVQFLEGEDDLLRRKILAAMKVGVSQGHDALVLPPHGTDAGQNPSEAIAAIYRSVIGRDFMGGRKRFQTYKKIVMVLDPDQADRVVNETSNYRPAQPPAATATILPFEEDKEGEFEDADAEDDEDAENDGSEGTEDDGEASSLRRRFAKGESSDHDHDEEDDEVIDYGLAEEGSDNAQNQDDQDADANQDEEDEGEVINDFQGEDGDEELVAQLALDDEVSDTDALLEEQLPQEGEILDEQEESAALDEDLEASNMPIDTSDDDKDETDGSEHEEDDEEEEEGDESQEEFVQIVETVREVFERMLEERSLLIIKNRARGLLDTDESDRNKAAEPAGNATTTEAEGGAPSASITVAAL